MQPLLPIDWAQTMIIPWVRDCLFDSDTVGQLVFCDFLQVPLAFLSMPSKLIEIAPFQHLTVALFHALRICSLGRACLAALVGFTLQPASELTQGLQQVGIVGTLAIKLAEIISNTMWKTCRTYPLLQFREWKGEAFFGFVFPMLCFQVTKPGPLWDLKQIAATIDGPATFRTPWAWSLAWKKMGGRVQNEEVLYDSDVTLWFVKDIQRFYVIWGYDYDNDV